MTFGLFKYKVEHFNSDSLYRKDRDGVIYKYKEANKIIVEAYYKSLDLIEEERDSYLHAVYEKYYVYNKEDDEM